MPPEIAQRFFIGTGSSYDRIVKIFTYGADVYWKKKILASIPESQNILDLACGTGILTFKLTAQHPDSKIVGVDLMPEYLQQAARKLKVEKRSHIKFICGRAEEIKLRQKFDCIVSSYIPKYVAADILLKNITPLLESGGCLVLHDFAYPAHPVFRKLWGLHMRGMRIVGPVFFPEWQTVFDELTDFVMKTNWIAEYQAALNAFGYEQICIRKQTAGSSAILTAVRK